MHVLAIAASSSSRSINRALVEHAGRVLTTVVPDVDVEHLDLRELDLPLFSVDVEDELGSPPGARRLFEAITGADALVVSFAEHNGTYTAAWKSAFDWASRIGARVFQERPAVFLATSIGGRGGRGVLDDALAGAPYSGADVRASMTVPRFGDVFDLDAGRLTDPGLQAELEVALATLRAVEAG